MVTVKDKNGREIKVNDFIGSNEKLLKQYGYTRLESSPDVTMQTQKQPANIEKKSAKGVTVAAAENEAQIIAYTNQLLEQQKPWDEIAEAVDKQFKKKYSPQALKALSAPVSHKDTKAQSN